MPADLRSWLPPDHLAWQVIRVTGQLDLSGFAAAYRADGQGQAPYDPAMMVPLVLYCYFKGTRPSRKIAAACIDDVGCRVICAGAAPSHQAVAAFIRRHRGEIRRLFVQVLSVLAAEGAVTGHLAAVDGSPVSANASRYSNMTGAQLQDKIAAAQAAVEAAQERLDAAEAAQAAKMDAWACAVAAGKAWRYGKIPVPAQQAVRVARVRKNLGTAQARLAAARQAAAGSPARVSATDPDSRLLPAKNGGFLQGWNLQLTAARRQILLAAELHDNPAGNGALITMITTAAANCEQAGLAGQIRAWLAGNGYACAATFTELDHLMLLVAVSGEAAQTGRINAAAAIPQGWEKMAARLATPAGKRLYRRRAALVEPAFAQFFARFGRYLNYRGHDAADTEIKLLATVHNLGKLFEYRRRHPAPAT